MDSIFLDKIPSSPFDVPREPASDPDYIKHVYCDGARFHVKSWSSFGTRCSEPKCIYNKYYNKNKSEGREPSFAVLDRQ